jgi:hypothetical protein
LGFRAAGAVTGWDAMAILFSGDFHGNAAGELSYISKKKLIEEHGEEAFNSIAYHIILGDGGFLWPKNEKTDAYNFRVLSCRPFPVLCVIGNHEPILGMIPGMEETDIGIGEPVYKIHDNPLVAYLKRGKIYTIDGFKVLALGGALSVDLERRTPNVSWWENEYWTEPEKEDLFKLLANDNSFDFVVSHTGPDSVNKMVFYNSMINTKKFRDHVAVLNDTIDDMISCGQWWCGHWHQDRCFCDRRRERAYRYLYHDTVVWTA